MDGLRDVGIAVIGGGLTGLSLAHQLYRSGVRDVEIFEAGPTASGLHKEMLSEADALRMWQVPTSDQSYHRAWATTLPPHYRRGSGIRRRLGGRSLYWHGVCLPIEHQALRSGWPGSIADDLSPTESQMGLYASVQHELQAWIGGPLGGCQSPDEADLLVTLKAAGYRSAAPVPQAARLVRVGGAEKRVPFTPLDYWNSRPPGASLPSIRTCSPALSVRQGRAGRLLVTLDVGTGAPRILCADKVVLAAGTFENTRLIAEYLMSESSSNELCIPNLTDHIVQGFVAVAPRRAVPFGNHGRAFCYIPEYSSFKSNLFVETAAHPCDDALIVRGWAMGEQEPPGSTIRILRTVRRDLAMTVDVSLAHGDREVVREQNEALASLAASILPADCPKLVFDPEGYTRGVPSYMSALSRALRARAPAHRSEVFPYVYPLGSVDHEAGTLAFGQMMGLHGELPQLGNLSVLGPCLFPRSGAANPALTIMALAKRHASELAKAILCPLSQLT